MPFRKMRLISTLFVTSWKLASAGTLALLALLIAPNSSRSEEPLQYNRDIRPILAEHCFACHGLDKLSREADLRIDVRESAIDAGALVPGEPDESEMIARIMTDDPDLVMPPPELKKPLSDEQRAKLSRWVEEGAAYEEHWAFIAPIAPEIPSVDDGNWARNAIDQFVLRRLQQEGLTPAPEAPPATLFRRLHLDITGLPPNPDDIEAFARDYAIHRDRALSAWIDKLMDTPSWGEHRGRYWLDAARYADTHGMHFDNYREMWPYRDWVIRSFNRNQPFNEFTVEQLAGDLFENPTLEQRVATGFQRCNMTTNEGGTIEAENLAVYASDRVQTIGWVYLGLTTNCCQCHDHKFDPLSMKDYYSLAAFFRNTTQTGFDGNAKDGKGPVIRVPSEDDQERWDVIDQEIAEAIRARDERRAQAKPSLEAWLAETTAQSLRDAVPADGRIVAVPLNDGPDEKIEVDSSVEGVSATAGGDLDWSVEGRLGPAVRFKKDGTVSLGAVGDFALDQPFSHAEWIRTSKLSQYSSPVAKMDEKNAFRGWDLFFSNGQLSMHLVQSWPDTAIKVTTQKAAIKPDTWHHVCVTWDGSGKPEGISIYVDGQKLGTTTNTNTIQADADIHTETPLKLGQRSDTAIFDGSVQDFHLYDRQLGLQEIESLRQAEWLAKLLDTDEAERSEADTSALLDFYLSHHDDAYASLTERVEALQSEKAAIESRSPITHVQVERMDQKAQANILMRGQYDQVGDQVMAQTPGALHPLSPDAPRNRLGLAQWIVDPANPLTARVTVNRFWQELFGQGIVLTTEDFGIMGTPPTHPDLLDWLATDFVEQGWDVKRFFKQVMMSATYRQAALITPEKLERDRDNLLLSRGPRFRMDAEMVRDYALTVSGLRSNTMYGPGVRPYQPTNIWNMVGLPGGDTRNYKQGSGEDLYRRSIYTFWKRMAPPPSLEAFNAPNREVCTVRRERTNTPLQALVTLNDPQYVEAARVLAEQVIQAGDKETSIANAIALRVLGRRFNDEELRIVLAAQDDYAKYYASHPEDAARLVKVGESALVESLDPAALAAWTMTCNQVMNLDEALTK